MDSFENTTITVYFGVDIDNGVIYKGANGRRIYILDKNENIIVGGYQNSDYENHLQIGIGGSGNAFQGAVFKSLKIYRLNNLEYAT